MRTRFAPSPTGYLHLGHALSALFAFDRAREPGGSFILRIEDLDPIRCRDEFITATEEDLSWLGLEWDGPVRRQSQHFDDYAKALEILRQRGLLYPCFCTRADIADAGHAPHGPDGPLYNGRCKDLAVAEIVDRQASGQAFALRLDMAMAVAQAGPMEWVDRARGRQVALPEQFGDVVLARKDVPASYHLAVTVDDALQQITLVTRGEDLFAATHVHRLLQALLDLPTPEYHHHGLLLGPDGKRLAKRDKAQTLAALRAQGVRPQDIRRMVGLS